VRRALVPGAGEHLRQQDGEHDVAGRLGVRAAAAGHPQGDEEQRADVSGHGHSLPGGEDGRAPD